MRRRTGLAILDKVNVLQAVILGIVQGLTEFIPVSSSGHLVVVQEWLATGEGGLLFDVALHTGTLLALVVFFYQDIVRLAKGFLSGGRDRRLVWLLAAATVPAVIVGLVLQDLAATTFRSPTLVGINLIIVAVLMLLAEKVGRRKTRLEKIGFGQAMVVGCAQALALVPGVSRSGSTITAGLFTGLDRVAATRFAFLLAIPITFGAILKVLFFSGDTLVFDHSAAVLLAGIGTSFISGILAIRFLLRFLQRHSINIFAYYRIALGVAVLLLSLR